MADDDQIIHSPLQQTTTRDGISVEILIYRGTDEEGWILEVEDESGGSTVWDDRFPRDQDALDEAMRTIEAEGINSFAAANGIPLPQRS